MRIVRAFVSCKLVPPGTMGLLLWSAIAVFGQQTAAPPDIPTGLILMDPARYQSIPLASTPLMGELPRSIDLSSHFPVPGNQGQQASCVGWAISYLKSYQEALERDTLPNTTDKVYSPAFVYNQIKTVPNCKGGTSFESGLNLIRRDGIASWADFPYTEKDCSRKPDGPVLQSAKFFRIAEWRRVNVQDETEVKNNLAAGFPVLFGMLVDRPFHDLRGNQLYARFSGDNLGAHAMVVVGFDDSVGAFKIINSWGTEWGDRGFGWISYSAFKQAVREGYVAQDIIVKTPVPGPGPVPRPGPEPVLPVAPLVVVNAPQVQHNVPIPNGLIPPNNVGMLIRATGEVRNARGRTLQLVVRFSFQNGQPVIADPRELSFRDVHGIAATGTQPFQVTSDELNLADYQMTIPYYAMGFPYVGGRNHYSLSMSVSVYLDNYVVAQSAPTPFSLNW